MKIASAWRSANMGHFVDSYNFDRRLRDFLLSPEVARLYETDRRDHKGWKHIKIKTGLSVEKRKKNRR